MEIKNNGVINTVCSLCVDNCGMEVEVEDGIISKIKGLKEHPFSKGQLCIKGMMARELAYTEDRLKFPLKKEKGEWKEISWDEALDISCEKLNHLSEKWGRESLIVYFGDPMIFQGLGMYYMKLFCQLYGTPNLCCTGSLCNVTKVFGNILTCGRWTSPDYENSKMIILWGTNPLVSSLKTRLKILNAKKDDAKIVVIDPRFTQSAKIADKHIAIRPGTDGALALGMINVIIKEELYDRDFVEKYTTGFSDLKELAEGYTPSKVEDITYIKSSTIKDLARSFATIKPSSIDQGSALEHHTNGMQNIRAVTLLLSITGNLDIKGGNIFPNVVPTPQPKPKKT